MLRRLVVLGLLWIPRAATVESVPTPAPVVAAAAPWRGVVARPPAPASHQEVELWVRLAPGAWRPSEEALPSMDLNELLRPPDEAWPEPGVDPVVDALYDGLVEGGEDQRFLELARAEGLLAADPSRYDDEWTRYAALWAAYADAAERAVFFLEPEDAAWLADEVMASLERAPRGPTAEPLRLAWLLLSGDAADPELVTEQLAHLEEAEDATLRAAAVQMQWNGERIAAEALLRHPTVRAGELRPLLLALEVATEASAWAEASALVERVLAHPEARPELRRELVALAHWLDRPALHAPWDRLEDEVQQCADVAPGMEATFDLRDGRLWPTSEGPVADCLHGLPVEAPAGQLLVHTVR